MDPLANVGIFINNFSILCSIRLPIPIRLVNNRLYPMLKVCPLSRISHNLDVIATIVFFALILALSKVNVNS